MTSIYNRRKFPRWPLARAVQVRVLRRDLTKKITSEDLTTKGGLSKNISSGGICIIHPRFLPTGKEVEIQGEIVDTRHSFSGIARVVWVQQVAYTGDQYLIGLEFVQLFEDSAKVIGSLKQSSKDVSHGSL